PWYRLARMQESFGVPMPESVQFERCEAVADAALPVFLLMRRMAADAEVVYSDDTRVKILSCLKEYEELEEEERVSFRQNGVGPKKNCAEAILPKGHGRSNEDGADNHQKPVHKRISAAAMMESVLACKWSARILSLIRDGVNRPGAITRGLDGLT